MFNFSDVGETIKRNKLLTLLLALVTIAFLSQAFLGDEGSGSSSDLWMGKYSYVVKDRIDGFEASANCQALQREFDTADNNDDATRRRTGTGTADLMSYIDGALRDAGCYG